MPRVDKIWRQVQDDFYGIQVGVKIFEYLKSFEKDWQVDQYDGITDSKFETTINFLH